MTLRQVYDIKNNQLTIVLPEGFTKQRRVLVTVEEAVDSYTEKLLLLRQASTDPLFQADIKEVNDDFETVDYETL